MLRTRVTRVGFWSFIKFWVIFGAICGLIFGVLSLIGALFGADVTADVVGAQFEGVRAGVVSLVWGPVLACLISLITSPFLYFPFRWALQLSGGLSVVSQDEADDHRDA